jgi:hypothetical protein
VLCQFHDEDGPVPPGLALFDLSDSTLTSIRPLVAGEEDFIRYPVISPDGARVAYVAIRHGQLTLRVVGLDGSGDSIVVADATSPTWRDSDRLIYVNHSYVDGPMVGVLWEVHLSTGARRQIAERWPQDCSPFMMRGSPDDASRWWDVPRVPWKSVTPS